MKVVTIGRSKENNDIVVNDEKVSRNHLQMIMDDQGNYSVLDLNSTNGTYVNGRRITGQVPLKITDELRIGDTVLSWQCYFDSQANTGTLHSKTSQPSVARRSDLPQEPIADPKPKRWLVYVIIGALVLLLVGGGMALMMYKQRTDSNVATAKAEKDYQEAEAEYQKAEAELQKAEAESAQAAKELAETQARADRTRAVADSMARIAAEKNTEEAKTLAQKAKEEAGAAEAAKKEAEQRLSSASQAKAKVEEKRDSLQQELGNTRTELQNTQEELNKTKEKLLMAQRESRKRLFNSYLKQMKGHEDDFCKKQGWDKSGGAKKAIENNYKNASDADQQKIIDAMEAYANTIESANVEKPQTTGKGTAESDTTKK